jgi:hypothetical protein
MAPREDDKAMAGLLRRSLASNSGAKRAEDDCPGTDILAAYYERSLDRGETSRYELHFSQCARCREQLAIMARAEEGPQPRSARAQLWDWRWLGLAAAVLLFVVVWPARRSAPVATTDHLSKAPLVAILRPEQQPAPEAGEAPLPSRTAPSSPAAPPSGRPHSARVPGAPSSDSNALGNEQQPAPDLPINGREYTELRALTAGPRSPLHEPGRTNGDLAGSSSDQSGTAAPGAPKTRQMQSAAVSSYGAANQPGPAEIEAERSIQVLIRTPNPKVLWRIAGGGLIERSVNGGATWQGQLPDSKAHLVAGAAPKLRVCWVVGRDGLILLTKDATNWEKIPPPIPADFIAVTAKDASSATVITSDGRKFITGDGGKKWTLGQ